MPINIDDLTIKEANELVQLVRLFGSSPQVASFFKTGEKYLIRTVTMIYVGLLIDQNQTELLVTNCSWIAETARWSDTLEKGTFSEVEPYPSDVIIPRAVIVDATFWLHDLPEEQK